MIIMAQPTQEMDISSSVTLNDNLANNNSTTQFYEKEITMDETDEIDFLWIHNSYVNIPAKHESQEILHNQFIDVKSYENIFPWLNKFNKIMCSSAGNKNYQLLKHLLLLYKQNILNSINMYCEKVSDMIKLKNHISSTLTFFHLYWHEIKEDVDDYEWYLNEMAALLGIYVDLELQTFKPDMDSSKLAAKLLSALWIYLNNSEKHIFRVLLKLKFVTKKYSKICDPIFMKSFAGLEKNMESLIDIDYVRYLLVLKLWQRMKENVKEKKEVNKIALTILGSCIPKMRDELLEIIPKPPIEYENETIWLLQPNVFDLKTASRNFLAFENAMSVCFEDSRILFCDVQEHAVNHELKRNRISSLRNNCAFENQTQSSKTVNQMFLIDTRNKFRKYKKASKLKPGEIILIDLTKEDELTVNKKKNKKRNHKKLEWLQMARKKYKVQKRSDEIERANQVENTDTRSKESSENIPDKVVLEYLSVLDNKISESTENCISPDQEPMKDNTHYINSQNIYGYILNKRHNELKCLLQHSDIKQINLQRHKLLALLKLLDTMGQSIKVPKTILALLKESREENDASQHNFLSKSTANKSSVIDAQGREESFCQPKSSIETISLSKECQNNVTNTQSIKQELSINTDCNMMQTDTYCQNQPVYVQSDCHLHDFISTMSSHGSVITEAAKQKISCDTQECTSYCTKVETKPFSCHNNGMFNTVKNEDATDKKLICDKNVICMLSDLDKCMNVLNRIGEHIMTVHTEKQRLECLDKTDTCTVATTVFDDQIAASSSSWVQNINSSTNLEKLNKLLELYEKKELPNVCSCQDFHRRNDKDSSTILNQGKYDPINCKKVAVSTSQPREYCSYRKDDENKSPRSFVCNQIKSEIEQSVKEEDSENFRILTNEPEETNVDTRTYESFIDDSQHTKKLDQDVYCESMFQNSLQKINVTKTRSVDEFENTDILDNILNGDITIEDEQEILEDWQSPLMSPINYDNSNNVLNCIADFFSQSEHTYKKEEKYNMADTANAKIPLPEGSLGTVGILNSLFDFDLTNMDFPSNDFMYSNVQAVDPRSIKKTFETDSFLTKEYGALELNSEDKTSTINTNNKENIFSQKDKELCSTHNYLIDSSVDVVGFGLNTSKEKALEFPSLIKNLSSSDQSASLVSSDNISSEVKESFPKCSLANFTSKFDIDSITEKSYIFQKDDVNQIEYFNDTMNQVSSETCNSNETLLNPSINCTPKQQDDIQSSDKHIYLEFESNPSMVKQSLDSCDLLSSTDLIQCNTNIIPQCIEQEHEGSIKQRNIQKNIEYGCKEKQSYTTKHRVEAQTQCRSSNRNLKYKKKIKMKKKKKEELISPIVQSEHNELSLRCSQLTGINLLNHQDTQNACELPLSTFHVSYCQKSPQIICTSENEYKQLKRVGIQRLRNISQRKQQMLLNFHNDSVIDAIFKEDSKLENFKHTTEDNISEDSNAPRLFEDPHMSDNKTCVKFLKKNIKLDKDVSKVNVTTDKRTGDITNNILVKSDTNWTLQDTDTQSSKFIEKQMIMTVDEEMPLKKRKLASKLASNLEANTVVYSVNQEKMQKKRFTSVKKDVICASRRKNKR